MPFDKEHSARVREPGDFIEDSIRRSNISDGIDLLSGQLLEDQVPEGGDPESMVTQSYRFDAAKFSAQEAQDWLEEEGIEVIEFEEASDEEAEEAAEPEDNDDKDDKNGTDEDDGKPIEDDTEDYLVREAKAREKYAGLVNLAAGTYSAKCKMKALAMPTVTAIAAPGEDEGEEPAASEDGKIRREFRLLSGDQIITDSQGLVLSIPGEVLEAAAPMFAERLDARGRGGPMPLRLDHDRAADRIVGRVESSSFAAAESFEGIEIPAGVNGVVAVDPELDPKVAKLVDEGLINAVSAHWTQEWVPSHPEMGLWEFLVSMGDVVEGEIVHMKASKITAVREVSLVDFGADPFALAAKADGGAAEEEMLKEILAACGLADDTSAEKAINQIKGQAEAMQAAQAELATAQAELAEVKAELEALKAAAQAEARKHKVEKAVAEGRLTPAEAKAMAPWAQASPESFEAFVAARKPGEGVPLGVQFNEIPAPAPEDVIPAGADPKVVEALKPLAEKLGMSVAELLAGKPAPPRK